MNHVDGACCSHELKAEMLLNRDVGIQVDSAEFLVSFEHCVIRRTVRNQWPQRFRGDRAIWLLLHSLVLLIMNLYETLRELASCGYHRILNEVDKFATPFG